MMPHIREVLLEIIASEERDLANIELYCEKISELMVVLGQPEDTAIAKKLRSYVEPFFEIKRRISEVPQTKDLEANLSEQALARMISDYIASSCFLEILNYRLSIITRYPDHNNFLKELFANRKDISQEFKFADFENLMSAPFQRLPRYQLLADALLKELGDTHKDNLSKNIGRMAELLRDIGSLASEYSNKTALIGTYFNGENDIRNRESSKIEAFVSEQLSKIERELADKLADKLEINGISRKARLSPGECDRLSVSLNKTALLKSKEAMFLTLAKSQTRIDKTIALLVSELMKRCSEIKDQIVVKHADAKQLAQEIQEVSVQSRPVYGSRRVGELRKHFEDLAAREKKGVIPSPSTTRSTSQKNEPEITNEPHQPRQQNAPSRSRAQTLSALFKRDKTEKKNTLIITRAPSAIM